jgi:hypothetical protein
VQIERKRIVVIQADGTRVVVDVGERLIGPVGVEDSGRNCAMNSVGDGDETKVRTEAIEVKDEYEGEWEAPVGSYDMT